MTARTAPAGYTRVMSVRMKEAMLALAGVAWVAAAVGVFALQALDERDAGDRERAFHEWVDARRAISTVGADSPPPPGR